MAFKVEYHDEGNFIFLKYDGKTTYKELQAATQHGNELAKTHNCFNILSDVSNTEPAIGTYDIYDFPRFYASLGVPHTARMAVVATTRNQADVHFYETVCRNGGFTVETFEDVESARKWLKKGQETS